MLFQNENEKDVFISLIFSGYTKNQALRFIKENNIEHSSSSELIDEVHSFRDQLLLEGDPDVPPDRLKARRRRMPKNVITFGASIFKKSFNSADAQKRTKEFFQHSGLGDVNIYDDSVSGTRADNYRVRIDALIDAHRGLEDVDLIMHGSGNDVSAYRPYSGASSSNLNNLIDDLTYVAKAVREAGWGFVYVGCSYRNYSGMANESEGSLPFNENVFWPIARSLGNAFYDEDLNRPYIDVYSLTKNNPFMLSPDGVHTTGSGERALASFVCNKYAQLVLNKTQSDLSGKRLIVAFDNDTQYLGLPLLNGINFDYVTDGTASNHQLVDSDNNVLFGVSFSAYGSINPASSGRDDAGDSSVSLKNSSVLKSFIYTGNDDVVNCVFKGLPVGATGKMRMTASRDTTSTDRVTEYHYSGETKEIDAALVVPAVIEFSFAVDAEGEIKFTFNRKAGNAYGYLNGVELTFD